MCIRNTGIWTVGLLIFILGNGCKKSEASGSQEAGAAKAPTGPLATIHWVGTKRLASDPNAAGFLKIWGLPETDRLKAETLDKLALAPWGLWRTNHSLTLTNYAPLVRQNPSAALLRPLLDDLVEEESFLEIRELKSQSPQLALAIHLNPQRAGLWETNLAGVIEALTGSRQQVTQTAGVSRGWQIQPTAQPLQPVLLRQVRLARSGDWTVVGLAAETNQAFEELLIRLKSGQAPLVIGQSKGWLDTVLDLRRLSKTLSWGLDLPEDWPTVSLSLNSDGKELLTSGRLNFPKPLAFQIEPWDIPTNLIHEPLHGFTAVQGIKPWLSSWGWWQKLKAGAPPNQLFCWEQSGSPFLEYLAVPLSDASSVMTKLGPAVMDSLNPLLSSNRMGRWERSTNSDGIVWNRAPIIAPFIRSMTPPKPHFLLAGVTPALIVNTPPPTGTLKDLLSQPNVVYFNREVTGPRIEAWMYLSQLSRIIFRREQLPSEAKAVAWLKASGPFIGPSKTTLTKTGPAELSLSRSSSIGLTAPELHLLADWLESPQFPAHLFSTVAKLPPPRSPGGKKPAPLPR